MAIVALSSIPTLRNLYSNGTLKAAKEPLRYPPASSYLDRVSLVKGDITKLEVDCIVNAANRTLLGGSGVDGAIHRAAGTELLEECSKLNGCHTGDAKITEAYNLPSKKIIHTVGPVYSLNNVEAKAAQLASCYKKSLELAVDNSLKHIAFPCISTGVYSYPIEDATRIALNQTRRFLDSEDGPKLDRVIFTVFLDSDKEMYETLIPEYFADLEVEN